MSEIKNQIVERMDGSFLIEEKHTIADIARWIIEQDWVDEFLWCIKEEMGGEQ